MRNAYKAKIFTTKYMLTSKINEMSSLIWTGLGNRASRLYGTIKCIFLL